MRIGIPKEMASTERRVAAVPDTVTKMIKAGLEVWVEGGAGEGSFIADESYTAVGAHIAKDAKTLYENADVVLQVNPPPVLAAQSMHPKSTLIAPLFIARDPSLLKLLIDRKLTAFALDFLPRIARAQSMDILSSMSNLAGYKSIILAANHLSKMFPMMTTAAGTIMPAKVIVIGAGVAGLQAIATAKRLGAVVLGFDTRPATEEQIKSLGAEFVSLETTHQAEDQSGYAKEQSAEFYKNEQAIIAKYIKETDVIVTTALIPGKRAPILLTEAMVKMMKPGSVIVDLSAEQGGNCELTDFGNIVTKHAVTIIGVAKLPSTLAVNASQLYAKNIYTFLNYVKTQIETQSFDLEDEIIKNCLVTHDGEVMHPGLKSGVKDESNAR